MLTVMGWDIGGANCKAARLVLDGARVVERRWAERPLAIWREFGRLPDVVREMAAALGPADRHALTMTAELADVFRTKREGVTRTAAAVAAALDGAPLHIWTVRRRFVSLRELAADPLPAAAANWMATAARLARSTENSLLMDIGSTTADIIPILNGQVAAAGLDDPGRLATGELVYTGVLRTPVCAVSAEVPVAGRPVRLAAEWFAIMADVHLILGHIGCQDYACETPDGRVPSLQSSLERLARAVCADLEALTPAAVRTAALSLWDAQAQKLTAATLQVLSRFPEAELPITGAGLGRFLARQAAGRLNLPYRDLEAVTGHGGQAAPAEAVAWLLGEEVAVP